MKLLLVFVAIFAIVNDQTAAQESRTGGVRAERSYRYISPEGEQVQMQYVADENGYQPPVAFVPQPHPIPPLILKYKLYSKK